jgi:hypothetical protein
VKRLEAALLSMGGLCIVIAIAFVDWRAGLGTAGLFLILATIDPPRRRP